MMIQDSLPLYKTGFFHDQFRKISTFYQKTAGYEMTNRFLSAVEEAFQRIASDPLRELEYNPPEGFKILQKTDYRKIVLSEFSPFPYTIYFEIEQDRIVIQSINHHARNQENRLSADLDD